MAKLGVLKPLRGTESSLANVVLEDGEITFETTHKYIYMGDGMNAVKDLPPFIGEWKYHGMVLPLNMIALNLNPGIYIIATSQLFSWEVLDMVGVMIVHADGYKDHSSFGEIYKKDPSTDFYKIYFTTTAAVFQNLHPTAEFQLYIRCIA